MISSQPPVFLRHCSIGDLSTLVCDLLKEMDYPARQSRLFLQYLRQKPGQGLTAVYTPGPRAQMQDRPLPLISALVEGTAPEERSLRLLCERKLRTALPASLPGIIEIAEAGLTLQTFPYDRRLPALKECSEAAPGQPLFAALQAAAWTILRDEGWHLEEVLVEPMRYKPASRCVLRYHLRLRQSGTRRTRDTQIRLFGKLYAERERACTLYQRLQRLYAAATEQGRLLLPRPVGLLAEQGLILSEAIERRPFSTEVRTGLETLRPQQKKGRSEVLATEEPGYALRLAGEALAFLHGSPIEPSGGARTGAREALKVHERATALAVYLPEQARIALTVAEQLAPRLEGLQPEQYRPVHGGYKASQLLFCDESAFVVDFDGLSLADPALDVGYFLAYLHPTGLWYQRAGTRAWFEHASQLFVEAYSQALADQGYEQESIAEVLRRANLYEAATLLKIACRRIHRLNSPRPGEAAAQLAESIRLLARY
jgi:aminoglycoside phosphotransferase (APT) family kinase protein